MKKRFLTICQGGQVRSVGMKYALTYRFGFGECVAMGVEGNTKEWIEEIAETVDHVILMDGTLVPSMSRNINYHLCDVGPDVYGNPFHPDLQEKIAKWLVVNGKYL